MTQVICKQRGCTAEVESEEVANALTHCPVCNNPLIRDLDAAELSQASGGTASVSFI